MGFSLEISSSFCPFCGFSRILSRIIRVYQRISSSFCSATACTFSLREESVFVLSSHATRGTSVSVHLISLLRHMDAPSRPRAGGTKRMMSFSPLLNGGVPHQLPHYHLFFF